MSQQLNPCPNCRDPEPVLAESHRWFGKGWRIECITCRHHTEWQPTREAADAKWNEQKQPMETSK